MVEIILKDIKYCDSIITDKVLEMRNHTDIRKWMYNTHIISKEEHTQWLQVLKTDSVYVIIKDDVVTGIVSKYDMDIDNKSIKWAFYINPSDKTGLGAIIEYHFINHIFNNTDINTLRCEVLESNVSTLKLHSKFNFGVDNISYNGVLGINIHYLSLTKENWLIHQPVLYNKYRKVFDKYHVKLVELL